MHACHGNGIQFFMEPNYYPHPPNKIRNIRNHFCEKNLFGVLGPILQKRTVADDFALEISRPSYCHVTAGQPGRVFLAALCLYLIASGLQQSPRATARLQRQPFRRTVNDDVDLIKETHVYRWYFYLTLIEPLTNEVNGTLLQIKFN